MFYCTCTVFNVCRNSSFSSYRIAMEGRLMYVGLSQKKIVSSQIKKKFYQATHIRKNDKELFPHLIGYSRSYALRGSKTEDQLESWRHLQMQNVRWNLPALKRDEVQKSLDGRPQLSPMYTWWIWRRKNSLNVDLMLRCCSAMWYLKTLSTYFEKAMRECGTK